MTRHRALLFAILVYVTLDLSLAMMPGAFVFDPSDSIESVHVNRGRTAAELPVLPGPSPEGAVPLKPRSELRDRLAAPPPPVERRDHAVVTVLHRPPAEAAPASEDPH